MTEKPEWPAAAIPTEKISIHDRTFAITPPWMSVPQALVHSIRQAGILWPVLVVGSGTEWVVVSGFRRVDAARQLGFDQVPCRISEGESEEVLFRRALWENVGTRRLEVLEQAEAVRRLSQVYGAAEEELLDRILPALGLRSSRYQLEQLLSLAQLPAALQQAVGTGIVVPEIALKLAEWTLEEQSLLLGLIRTGQLGRNKQKQIVELAGDWRRAERSELTRLWEALGLETADTAGDGPPERLFERIRDRLMAQRYPELTRHEARYQELKAALGLPPGMRLQVPEYFEGNALSLSIEAGSVEELRRFAGKLSEIAESREIRSIFDLL